MSKRVIVIRYDVTNDVLRDAEGFEVTEENRPFINFKEKPLVNLYLVTDESLTAYTGLDGTEGYSASVDSDFDHDTVLMCKTEASGINLAGDWEQNSIGTADPTQGEFSIRLDANNTNYDTKIGTTQEKAAAKLELLATSGAGDVEGVFRFPFRCFNIQDDEGQTPASLAFAVYLEEFTYVGKIFYTCNQF